MTSVRSRLGALAPPLTAALGARTAPGLGLVFAVIFAGALMAALVPPVQSPDETDHLKRAYFLSRGRFLLQTPEGQSSGGDIDDGLMDYIRAHLPLIERKEGLSLPIRANARELRWAKREHFESAPGTGYYFPAVYLPQAAALFLGRALGLRIETTYGLARFLCFGLAMAMIWLGARRWPLSPAALALLLLPMTLFQFVSPTIDGLTTGLAVLTIATWLQAMDRDQPLTRATVLTLFFGVLVLTTSRINLLPLWGLMLALAVVRRSRDAAWATGGLALLIPAWLGYAMRATHDLRVVRETSTGQALAHYLTHPLELTRVLGSSFGDAELMTFYGDSFVGILGWLDTVLEPWVYPLTGWILLGLLVLSFSWKEFRARLTPRLLLLLAAALSALLVMVALLLTWTPLPARLVSGVQGRYFIVPALMAAFAIGRGDATPASPFTALARVVLMGWALVVTSSAAHSILMRFHERVMEPQIAQRTTPPLADSAPLPLRFTAAHQSNDEPLKSLDIRFGTYNRENPGRALLRLVTAHGVVTTLPVELPALVDNGYAHFELEPADYVGGELSFDTGGGISIWEAVDAAQNAASCIIYTYASGRRADTQGCPP